MVKHCFVSLLRKHHQLYLPAAGFVLVHVLLIIFSYVVTFEVTLLMLYCTHLMLD